MPGEMPPTPAEGRRSTQQASGFIGQGQPPASAYHDSDFKFEDHAREVRHLVEEQHARGAQLLQSTAAAAGGGLTRTSAYSSESWDAFYR